MRVCLFVYVERNDPMQSTSLDSHSAIERRTVSCWPGSENAIIVLNSQRIRRPVGHCREMMHNGSSYIMFFGSFVFVLFVFFIALLKVAHTFSLNLSTLHSLVIASTSSFFYFLVSFLFHLLLFSSGYLREKERVREYLPNTIIIPIRITVRRKSSWKTILALVR